jgi:HEAT repeat protein
MAIFGPNINKLLEKGDLKGLVAVLQDKEPKNRAAAASALGKLSRADAIRPLLLTVFDPVAAVQEAAAVALDDLFKPEMLFLAIHLLEDEDPQVRKAAVALLGGVEEKGFTSSSLPDFDADTIDLLVTILVGPDSNLQDLAGPLLNLAGPAPVQRLVAELSQAGGLTWKSERIVQALGRTRSPSAIEPLVDLIGHSNIPISTTLAALRQIGPPAEGPLKYHLLKAMISMENPSLQMAACMAMGILRNPGAVVPLTRVLAGSSHEEVRIQAALALAKIGDKKAIPALSAACIENKGEVRKVIVSTLDTLGWQPDRSVSGLVYCAEKRQWDQLADLGGGAAFSYLLEALLDRHGAPVEIVPAIQKVAGERAGDVLLANFNSQKENDQPRRSVLAESLALIGSIPALAAAYQVEGDATIRAVLLDGLGRAAIGGATRSPEKDSVEPLIAALSDPKDNLRRIAVRYLGLLKDWRAVEPLSRLAQTDPFADIRQAALGAIAQINTHPQKSP